MITITRRQARSLRAVLRRRHVGPRFGHAPPLDLAVDPDAGLRVRYRASAIALECLLPGTPRPKEAVLLPIDALRALEARDDSPLVLWADPATRTWARWDQDGVTQTRGHDVPPPRWRRPFPRRPDDLEDAPADLLGTLARGGGYDGWGGPLRLVGGSDQVIDGSGYAESLEGGYRFPWRGEAWVPSSPCFARVERERRRPPRVGRTGDHVVIEAWPWTLWLLLLPPREPDVEA